MKYEFDISIGIEDVLRVDSDNTIKSKDKLISEEELQNMLVSLRLNGKYSSCELCHDLLNELSKWAEEYSKL